MTPVEQTISTGTPLCQLCYGAVLSKGRRRRRIKKRNRKSADISAEPFGIIVRWANRKKERNKKRNAVNGKMESTFNGVEEAWCCALDVLGVISLPGDRISSSSWSTSNRRRSIFDRRVEGDGPGTTLVRACSHCPDSFLFSLLAKEE